MSALNTLTTVAVVIIVLLALFYFVNWNNRNTQRTIETMENYSRRANAELLANSNVVPSEPVNEVPSAVVNKENRNKLPADCFPKDQLNPAELLPGDANSTWAKAVPNGMGELGDQNFLTAGYHVGINTIGSSLRNANYQIRSDPPCPTVQVSPWLQSTIAPDLSRRPLEIA